MYVRKLIQAISLPVLLLLFSFAATAQDRVVNGQVTDTAGRGLSGVSVTVKGQSARGTTTDANGSFSLPVPSAANTLIISSIGFLTQEVNIAGQTSITVSLQTAAGNLNEIVVTGYGTTRRRDVTGSIAKINERDLNQGPITNPLQQIAGRAAGVTINQAGSEPGVAPSIRIRGITSLGGGNDPLVVVDGIQGNLDLLNQVPPSEIESVDILKDASATAIYGSRGAAGVVLVTTKRGRAGKTILEYSGTAAIETIAKNFEMLSADEWRAEAQRRGISGADYGGNTNWFDLISRDGYTQNHNIAFGGGTSDFSYRASATAILQEGLLLNSGLRNFIGRFQGTQKALDNRLSMTFNLNTATQTNKWNGPGNIGGALQRRPTDPVYFKNAGGVDSAYFIDPNAFAYVNPYARTKEMIDGTESNTLFGSLRADLEVVRGLTAGFFGSWRRVNTLYGSYASPATTREDARNFRGIAQRNTNTTNERLMDLSLNYKRSSNGHNLDAIVVYEWQKAIYEGFAAEGRGFVNDLLTFNALQGSDFTLFRPGDINSYKNDRTIISFLGRVNYNYLNKYYLTASLRRDGASVFGANHKWGNFPAVSLAWRIAGENFMRDLSFFSDLKLRAGYGVTGNQQGLGPLNSVRLVRPGTSTFFGGQLIQDYTIYQNENKELRWETRKMANVGLDFAVLGNKLSGTIDFYQGNTEDLLFDYTVPQPPFPFGTIKANVGTIKNTGIEATLNYNLIRSKDFTVTLAGNITRNINKVIELSGTISLEGNSIPVNTDTVRWGAGGTTGVASTNNGISYLMRGYPIGTFFLFKHGGVDANGNQLIEDLNKNGQIDGNDRSPDRYIAGNALPKFTYAFTPSASYKNIDLSMVWRGSYGNKIYNARRATLSALAQFGQQNVLRDALETNISNIDYASDYWLEDGSFLRLDNMTLGYRIPFNSKFISSIRTSLTGTNLLVITDYKGIDPELRTDGSNGFGIDGGIYPRTRGIALGLNIIFK